MSRAAVAAAYMRGIQPRPPAGTVGALPAADGKRLASGLVMTDRSDPGVDRHHFVAVVANKEAPRRDKTQRAAR